MNKLREEVLLKIEEMGLLLSKEVRDRINEERQLRKQSLSDFDGKVREFVRSVAQNQTTATNKVTKRVTGLTKSLELSEKGWKQGVGSVAGVIRTLQPALDKEIVDRKECEGNLHSKMEQSLTAIAAELEAVTKRCFQQLEDLHQRHETQKSELAARNDILEKKALYLETDHAKELKQELNTKLDEIRYTLEERIDEERQKRGALEKEVTLNQGKTEMAMQALELKLTNRLEKLEDKVDKLEGWCSQEFAQLEAKNQQRIRDLEEMELNTDRKLQDLYKQVQKYVGENYTSLKEFNVHCDLVRQEFREKAEWLERTERELTFKLEEESNNRRNNLKSLETWASSQFDKHNLNLKNLNDWRNSEQKDLNDKTKDLIEHAGAAKRQIKELWTNLDAQQTNFNEFSSEQKMVLGFLDTQQKTKFNMLQKDVSNLLTLYGTGVGTGG